MFCELLELNPPTISPGYTIGGVHIWLDIQMGTQGHREL